jgi:hypothetical protein
VVQNFCIRKHLGAKKVQAKHSEMENLKINILIQNFKTKHNQRKKLKIKVRTHES